MSCITEILKLKGNKEVLLPLDDDGKPWIVVEGGGTHKDYEFLIVLNKLGHRCGYVAIKPNHPYDLDDKDENGQSNYWNIDINVHGGLTFMSRNHPLKTLISVPCTDQWIGFDCGHLYDKADFEAIEKYYGKEARNFNERYMSPFFTETNQMRTFPYVKKECLSIIEQLIVLEKSI